MYNPFRAEEATFLFTVLYILYTVRCYIQLHTIHYRAIITSYNYIENLSLNDNMFHGPSLAASVLSVLSLLPACNCTSSRTGDFPVL